MRAKIKKKIRRQRVNQTLTSDYHYHFRRDVHMNGAGVALNSNVYINQLRDRKRRFNVTLRHVGATIFFWSGKAVSVTYSECLPVALGTQHGMRMRRIVNCALSGSRNFSTLSHKRRDFRKKLLNINGVFYFLYKHCLKHFSFKEELGTI